VGSWCKVFSGERKRVEDPEGTFVTVGGSGESSRRRFTTRELEVYPASSYAA